MTSFWEFLRSSCWRFALDSTSEVIQATRHKSYHANSPDWRVADRLVQRIWEPHTPVLRVPVRVTFAATHYASALTSSNNSCHSRGRSFRTSLPVA